MFTHNSIYHPANKKITAENILLRNQGSVFMTCSFLPFYPFFIPTTKLLHTSINNNYEARLKVISLIISAVLFSDSWFIIWEVREKSFILFQSTSILDFSCLSFSFFATIHVFYSASKSVISRTNFFYWRFRLRVWYRSSLCKLKPDSIRFWCLW